MDFGINYRIVLGGFMFNVISYVVIILTLTLLLFVGYYSLIYGEWFNLIIELTGIGYCIFYIYFLTKDVNGEVE